MGCDLCVYVPAKEDHDCAMSYSTFDNIRVCIAALYLREKGYDIESAMFSVLQYGKICDLLREQYEKYIEGDEFAGYLLDWFKHSDCDGSYWWIECENIAKVLTYYVDKMPDTYYKGFVEALIDTFTYAAHVEGVVEVC